MSRIFFLTLTVFFSQCMISSVQQNGRGATFYFPAVNLNNTRLLSKQSHKKMIAGIRLEVSFIPSTADAV
ncbi:MAG: hypothetical protein LBG96_15510 [Tannerella sp.]|nr:hypothetical protein [Tannerella sp.]